MSLDKKTLRIIDFALRVGRKETFATLIRFFKARYEIEPCPPAVVSTLIGLYEFSDKELKAFKKEEFPKLKQETRKVLEILGVYMADEESLNDLTDKELKEYKGITTKRLDVEILKFLNNLNTK